MHLGLKQQQQSNSRTHLAVRNYHINKRLSVHITDMSGVRLHRINEKCCLKKMFKSLADEGVQ